VDIAMWQYNTVQNQKRYDINRIHAEGYQSKFTYYSHGGFNQEHTERKTFSQSLEAVTIALIHGE
jgi:hypothetical protein